MRDWCRLIDEAPEYYSYWLKKDYPSRNVVESERLPLRRVAILVFFVLSLS